MNERRPFWECRLGGRRLQSRPFEIVTKNYVIRGSVSPFAASGDGGDEVLSSQKDPQHRAAGVVGNEVVGIAHVLNYLLAIIRDYSEAMVRWLDGPQRDDAREIFQSADAAAALVRWLLRRRADR